METTFETVILCFGNNAVIAVPPANLAALGTDKRPRNPSPLGEGDERATD